MTALRQPPPYRSQPKGTCKLCGLAILTDEGEPATRLNWHPACVGIWNIATSSSAARAALFARDKGVCSECGFDCEALSNQRLVSDKRWPIARGYSEGFCGDLYCPLVVEAVRPWHGDHIRPLWSVDREDPQALRFWMLDNLATLCEDCHKAKSALEAAQRAKEKRIRARLSGEVKRKRKIPSRPFSTQHRPLRRA